MIGKNCRTAAPWRSSRHSPCHISESLTWKAMKASLLHVSKSLFPDLSCVVFRGQHNLLSALARAGYSTRSWASNESQRRPHGLLHSSRNGIYDVKSTGTYGKTYPTTIRTSSWIQLSVRHASSASTTSETSGAANDAKAGTKIELPSQEESRRSPVSRRFSHIMDNVQSNIFIAGQRLNDLTGYSGIEALKKEIEGLGKPVQILHVMSS